MTSGLLTHNFREMSAVAENVDDTQSVKFEVVCETIKISQLPKSVADLGSDVDQRIIGPALWCKFKETRVELYNSNWIKCSKLSKVLLDITWEHLNTGHWKDVNIMWRYFYTYACLFKVISEYALWKDGNSKHDLQTAVKTCDIGFADGSTSVR